MNLQLQHLVPESFTIYDKSERFGRMYKRKLRNIFFYFAVIELTFFFTQYIFLPILYSWGNIPNFKIKDNIRREGLLKFEMHELSAKYYTLGYLHVNYNDPPGFYGYMGPEGSWNVCFGLFCFFVAWRHSMEKMENCNAPNPHLM